MVLGKLQVPGRPTNLDNSMARATALAVGAGGVVWAFLLSFLSSLSLSPPPLSLSGRRSDID